MKEKNNIASQTKVTDKIRSDANKESHAILQYLQPSIKVMIDTKTIINACVELVTVNGRPYSLMDDTGFKKLLEPVLNGLKKNITINSNTIK